MRIGNLDHQWLSHALNIDVGRIDNLRSAPLGAGQVADTYRIQFDVDGLPAPQLVLKLTSDDAHSAESGRRETNYLREVRFYQSLADGIDVRAPKCHHAEIAEGGLEFSLLLEDLAPCRSGDHLLGCTVKEAKLVAIEAAKLHASLWGDPKLDTYDWLPGIRTSTAEELAYMPMLFQSFCERYGDLLKPDIVKVGEAFFSNIAAYADAQRAAPATLQHGDFRLDNLLFEAAAGSAPVSVIDWQTIQKGPGVLDLAYFLGEALTLEDRRESERALLALYHGELVGRGVVGYTFADCWRDYTRFALQGFLVGVGAAMNVKRTERGDKVFVDMVDRAGQHALDLGSLDQLIGS